MGKIAVTACCCFLIAAFFTYITNSFWAGVFVFVVLAGILHAVGVFRR